MPVAGHVVNVGWFLAEQDPNELLLLSYRVGVPGLYFAGTLMQQRDFKKSTGGFIHGFRYAVRAFGRILDERHHDRPWPYRPLDASPSTPADAVVARVNRSSALWQQFGVIGDLIVAPPGEPARYHEEVPVAYARERQLS